MAAPIMVIVGCNFLADGMQVYLQGLIRGLGLQEVASYIALACYWLLGIPLAIVLTFVFDIGVVGLFGGFIAATGFQCLLYFVILVRTNWQEIADLAAERIKKEEEDISTYKVQSEGIVLS